LHHFLKKLKEDDLSTYKKAVSFIERLKDNPQDFKALHKFKKLKHKADLWELKISNETRFFLFYSAKNEICITHRYRKQRKNDKRLKQSSPAELHWVQPKT
jgi:predicted translin family RNA/ssDNA-binding protein